MPILGGNFDDLVSIPSGMGTVVVLLVFVVNEFFIGIKKTKQLLIDNGYPGDVPISCIKENLVKVPSEKQFGPEKWPVYLRLSWNGSIGSKFENQVNKTITSCFYVANLFAC